MTTPNGKPPATEPRTESADLREVETYADFDVTGDASGFDDYPTNQGKDEPETPIYRSHGRMEFGEDETVIGDESYTSLVALSDDSDTPLPPISGAGVPGMSRFRVPSAEISVDMLSSDDDLMMGSEVSALSMMEDTQEIGEDTALSEDAGANQLQAEGSLTEEDLADVSDELVRPLAMPGPPLWADEDRAPSTGSIVRTELEPDRHGAQNAAEALMSPAGRISTGTPNTPVGERMDSVPPLPPMVPDLPPLIKGKPATPLPVPVRPEYVMRPSHLSLKPVSRSRPPPAPSKTAIDVPLWRRLTPWLMIGGLVVAAVLLLVQWEQVSAWVNSWL